MRSIRLTLLVYFLSLVAASLGITSLLVYRVAQQTLRDKEEAAIKLIEARHEERCREARNQLDERLLARAKALAGRVRPVWRWDKIHNHIFHHKVLGALTVPVSPYGYVLAPLWAVHSPEERRIRGFPNVTPVQSQMWNRDLIDLTFGREVQLPPEDKELPRITALLETNHWSKPLRVGGPLPLPSEADFEPSERLALRYDDDVLAGGIPVRRVLFRVLLTLQEGGPRTGRGPRPSRAPALIIQCAANSQDLEETLEGFRFQRDLERQEVREETTAALAKQRNWLLIIAGFAFAGTILGSVGLVWLGLRPVRQLSDAVSAISPRNFTLSVDPHALPLELRPIADRLRSTLEMLKRAFAREKQATADISHELRTPLAALLTTIELALRKPRPIEQYREMLQDCHQSASQMHQIVERLLTLARLDAGVDRLRAQSIDVLDLVDQCATVVRPLAEARGLRLRVLHEEGMDRTQGEATRMSTDPDKLREVLNNLLHNAIQYNRPEGQIDLVVTRHNRQVRLEVRDTGIGISPDARDRIFERFYREDPSRTSDGLNAGLGLAIVKEYVELMGGQIRVESAPGQGSTFRVELPVQAPSSAA